jgi:hypothetical protein
MLPTLVTPAKQVPPRRVAFVLSVRTVFGGAAFHATLYYPHAPYNLMSRRPTDTPEVYIVVTAKPPSTCLHGESGLGIGMPHSERVRGHRR